MLQMRKLRFREVEPLVSERTQNSTHASQDFLYQEQHTTLSVTHSTNSCGVLTLMPGTSLGPMSRLLEQIRQEDNKQ